MAIRHESYDEHITDIKIIRAARKGQRAVRGMGELILRKTPQMRINDDIYKAYVSRARFYPALDSFLDGVRGFAFDKKPIFDGIDGKSLISSRKTNGFDLAVDILEEVALVGRCILINTYNKSGSPIISLYKAESLVNWHEDLSGNLVWARLLEHHNKSDDFKNKEMVVLYREFEMIEESIVTRLIDSDENIISSEQFITPLDDDGSSYFPVTIIGSRNLGAGFDTMPSLKVVDAVIAAYQISADKRQSNYIQAQPTFTATGIKEEEKDKILSSGFGVGAALLSTNERASFGMLEYSGSGLSSLDDDIRFELEQAAKHSMSMVKKEGNETAESVISRFKSKKASIWSILSTVQAGYSRALDIWNKWGTANAPTASFAFNVDLTAGRAESAMITALSNGVLSGHIPREVVYEYIRKSGLTDKDNSELDALIDNVNNIDEP